MKGGREALEGCDMCIFTADSCCYTAEINTTQSSHYTPIKFFKLFAVLNNLKQFKGKLRPICLRTTFTELTPFKKLHTTTYRKVQNIQIYYLKMLVSQSCLTLWDPMSCMQPTKFLCPWNSPGKNTGVGSDSLLQGTFPIQGQKLHLLQLLHCR